MTANLASEQTLLDQAIKWLDDELGAGFTVERSRRAVQNPGGEPLPVDDIVDIRTQNAQASFTAEVTQTFTPRDVERLFAGKTSTLARMANLNLLVVAPWLSLATRELLAAKGANYIDLTGNCLIRLDNPPLYIRVNGAAKDPQPPRERVVRLRGARAARLVRVLAEVQPPYGVRELAAAAKLNAGYVSQLIETLDREALIERDGRGPIRSVNYVRMIQLYSQSYDLLRTNRAQSFVAPAGTSRVLDALVDVSTPTAVTGSFAAARLAPIAAPTLLALYCADRDAVASTLQLLPADEGANVVLLDAFDPVVWDRTVVEDGRTYVSLAQTALDCLTGNGRMPAEGAALLTWMTQNESQWRARSLDELDAGRQESA